jgi:hypothetical protein
VARRAQPLSVTAKLRADGAEVSLSLGGRSVSAAAPTPLAAVVDGVAALQRQLAPPPPPESLAAQWGAKDAASARRIERAFRRIALRFPPSMNVDAREAIAADPESPWGHLMFADVVGGGEERAQAIARGIALANKLPPTRADAVRGFLLSIDTSVPPEEALRLLRRAYAGGEDDPEVLTLHAMGLLRVGPPDEAIAVVEHLYKRFPAKGLRPLNFATEMRDADLERVGKYIDWMVAVLPEALGWADRMHYLRLVRKPEEARAAAAFAEAFGAGAPQRGALAEVELSAFRPEDALRFANELFPDQRMAVSEWGARLRIAAYFMMGQVVRGQSLLLAEAQRQTDTGNPVRGARLRLMDLEHRRLLDQPGVDEEVLQSIEQALGMLSVSEAGLSGMWPAMTVTLVAKARCEIALARMRADPQRAEGHGRSALEGVEAWARTVANGDQTILEDMLVTTIPLMRTVRGQKSASQLWQRTGHASFAARRTVAFDAGLALEAAGDVGGAIEAYLLAQSPWHVEWHAFHLVASQVRLADLYRTEGRAREAAELDGLIDQLWISGADPGLREAVRRME